jgi:hypothetical protein
VNMENCMFSVIALCNRIFCPLLLFSCLVYSLTLKMGTKCSSGESVYFERTRLGLFFGSSTALFWALASPSVSCCNTQSEILLGRGISPSQGSYLHTGQHKHRINAHKHHTSSGIRTHDLNFGAVEDSSCLRPRPLRSAR